MTLGSHQGALFNNGNDLSCRLSFVRIYRFLEEHGSPLRHGERQPRGYVDEYLQQVMGGQSIEQVERRCLNELNEVYASASEVAPTFRLGHVHGCCKCISVLARGEDHDLAPTTGGATRAPAPPARRHPGRARRREKAHRARGTRPPIVETKKSAPRCEYPL